MSEEHRSAGSHPPHQATESQVHLFVARRKRIICTVLRPLSWFLGVPLPTQPHQYAGVPATPPPPPDPGLVQFSLPFEGLLPLESDDDLGDVAINRGAFLYEGKGYTPAEFVAYVDQYDFGTVPPNFIVLHHTYRPSISTASAGAQYDWDNGEAGLSDQEIYARRRRKLDGIKEYYRSSLGWDRGPHLFIDDRYIWIFTPMFHVGIHAAQGNGAVPNYSIGIEVIGYYERNRWADPVAYNVGIAVAALKRRLGTFE
jgi:hypothetical protein